MNSVERVKTICKDRKIPISKLERDLGYSNGYIGQLRKGTFPNDRLKEIAEYLEVSIDYLMTGKEKEGGETYYLNDETKEIEQEILSLPQKILTNTINWINEKRAKLERKLLELKQAIQDWIMEKLQQLQDWINKLLDNIKRFIQKQLERLANAILGWLD